LPAHPSKREKGGESLKKTYAWKGLTFSRIEELRKNNIV